ncbi:hypothetical protein ACFSC5_13235, partial [Oceanobacillus bengalensis]
NPLEMNLISLLKIEIEQNSLQMNLISSLKKIPQIIVTSQFISNAKIAQLFNYFDSTHIGT